jgi:hypothetical protein
MKNQACEISDKVIKKHIDFWSLCNTEALTARIPVMKWRKRPYPVKNAGEITEPKRVLPEDIDVDRMLGDIDGHHELLTGDLIDHVGCIYPTSWMEALIGCPIYVSAFSCSAKPVTEDVLKAIELFSLEDSLKSNWLKVMDEILHKAVGASNGEYPVKQLHQRGIIDMLAAYLGEGSLCLAAYDYPGKLKELAGKFAELHMNIAKRGLSIRGSWRNGYVSAWKVYAPEPLLDYQIDASSLFSPGMYKDLFFEYDRSIIRQFPYSIIHMHACGLHMLDVILTIEELGAIEIHLDRETGNWEKDRILECCRKIQESGKSIVLWGELSKEEFDEFTSVLRPGGLAICYWDPDTEKSS